MSLRGLLPLIEEMPAYRRLLAELESEKGSRRVVVLEAARPYLIAALYHHLKRPLLLITSQPQRGRHLAEQLSMWCHRPVIKLLPEAELLPYQQAISDSSTG